MSLAFGVRQPCEQTRRSETAVACSAAARRWVLTAAILGSSLAFIEGSVVNLALPALQVHFDLTSREVQWVVNSYLLVLGAGLLIGGVSGDRYGHRRIFIAGLSIFGAASLACGLVPNLAALLAGRAIQGLGAALLIPASLALISVHYPKAERPAAIGIWAGASAITTALGPVLGGLLVDHFGWASVFVGIAPLAVLTVGIATAFIPTTAVRNGGPLDLPGGALLAAFLFVISYALIDVRWSIETIVLILVAVGLLAGFIQWERRASSPMVPLVLFRSRAFFGANLMTLTLYFALTGALFFLPFNLIQIQGYSAAQAGAAFLPLTLLIGVGSIVLGGQLGRRSPRRVLGLGATVTAVGFAALAVPGADTTFARDWLPAIFLIGTGMTLCVAPLTNTVMGAVSDSEAGVASGINNTVSRVAGVLAMALLSGIAATSFADRLEQRLDNERIPRTEAAALLDRAAELGALQATESSADAAFVGDAIRLSYIETFRQLMLICAALGAISAIVAWSLLPRSAPSGEVDKEPAL